MKFKEDLDKEHWDNPPDIPFSQAQNARLKVFVHWIDTLCTLLGWGELTVTDYWREGDPKSYHYILQAVDARTKDKPRKFLEICLVLDTFFKRMGSDLQIYTHKELWGKPNEHIHIAIKDGSIKRP